MGRGENVDEHVEIIYCYDPKKAFDEPPKIDTAGGCLTWNTESMGVLSTGNKVRYRRESYLGFCHSLAEGPSLKGTATTWLVQSNMDISSLVYLAWQSMSIFEE